MSNKTGRHRPSVLQCIAYCYGRRLPGSMVDWVRNDLGGQGCDVPDDDPMGHPRRSCAGPVLADPDDVSRAPEYDSADFCAVCDVLARA